MAQIPGPVPSLALNAEAQARTNPIPAMVPRL